MQPSNFGGLGARLTSLTITLITLAHWPSATNNIIKVVQSRPTSDSEPVAPDPIHTIHYHFDKLMDPFMQVHKLDPTKSNNITCNDGTQAGYYKRLNNHSKSWIIYLQGGGFCGSEEACQQRWQRSPNLMSSNYWPRTKSVDGILSSESKDNPYLWNANHIYVPYCSSDSWTGLAEARADRSFVFMGSKILEKVIESLFEDLPRESSLYEAKFILLAGDSAGATGVILNLDKVNKFVQQKFNSLKVNCSLDTSNVCEPRQAPVLRGLADSGWFLDNEPFDFGRNGHQQQLNRANLADEFDCDRHQCTPLQSIKQAMLYWNGQVPPACSSRYPTEPWRCYFGYRAYQTLKTPLFVVQWLYDEVQLVFDNIGRPDTSSQWNYVNRVVNELRTSLENVTALFAPSCFSHSLVIKQNWNQININGFKLPHILNSWEEETLASQPNFEALLAEQESPFSGGQAPTHNYDKPTPFNLELRLAPHKPISGSNRSKSRKRKRNNQHYNRLGSNTNRLSRSTIVDDATLVLNNNVPDILVMQPTTTSRHRDSDKFRLIDSCGWPQCNRDCPVFDSEFSLRPLLPY